MKRRISGVTLIEIVIASSLSLVVLGLIVLLFVPVKLSCMTGDSKAEVNMNAYRSLSRMERELQSSSISSVTYDLAAAPTVPSALSFLSPFDRYGRFITDSTGKAVWQSYIIYYIPSGTKKLLRKTVTITPTSTARRLTLTQLQSRLDGTGDTAAFDASSFTISPKSAYSTYVDISIGTELIYSGRANAITLEGRAYPQN
ncbi:MAG: hypothetical protein AB9903_33350 [Vulcanimicrobiota bacterium]